MKKIYLSLIFITLIAGLVLTQRLSDTQRAKAQYIEPSIPRPELVKSMDLGLHNAAADLMWLSSIQYFGGGESRKNPKMPDYLRLTSDLDPKFSYPYAFGALILPGTGYVDDGIALAKKGIENGVQDWRIPYYLATTLDFEKGDTESALRYFDLAANTPGAPTGIQQVAASYGSRSDKREKTLQIWYGIYATTNDEVVKKRAQNYIIHFELLGLLEDAAKKYDTINKKYPATPQDLVDAKILTAVPPDPFGFQYTFDETGRPRVKND